VQSMARRPVVSRLTLLLCRRGEKPLRVHLPARPGNPVPGGYQLPYSGSATVDPKPVYGTQHLVVIVRRRCSSRRPDAHFESMNDRSRPTLPSSGNPDAASAAPELQAWEPARWRRMKAAALGGASSAVASWVVGSRVRSRVRWRTWAADRRSDHCRDIAGDHWRIRRRPCGRRVYVASRQRSAVVMLLMRSGCGFDLPSRRPAGNHGIEASRPGAQGSCVATVAPAAAVAPARPPCCWKP